MTGVHLALDREDSKLLFGRRDPALLLELLRDDLLQRIGGESRLETENWEVLHRLLGDGGLDADAVEHPLDQCFLGGRPLDAGEEMLVRMIRPDIVGHVATALANRSSDDVSTALSRLPPDYAGPRDADAAAATATAMAAMQRFFETAFQQRCAVLFCVSQ